MRFYQLSYLINFTHTPFCSSGKSVQGRDLWVIVVSETRKIFENVPLFIVIEFLQVSSSPYEHMLGKPDVKYIGNIHGNEAVGRELLLHLIEYFVTSYHTDTYIKWLLDNTRIHIMPSMNPGKLFIRQFYQKTVCNTFVSHRWLRCVERR